jgi:oxygen-independent coproporphyrinogen-3 oxidase
MSAQPSVLCLKTDDRVSGLYLHIPFCKQACHYCDFHFSVSLKNKEAVLNSMLKEIEVQSNFFEGEKLDTIYYGGGSPSILSEAELVEIQNKIYDTFPINDGAEISLEANPDDLSTEKLDSLKNAGINRLSIGIQSFRDEDLKLMNRVHNSDEAKRCISDARKAGFENFNIDLIYGIPGLSINDWKENLQIFFDYDLPHLSAYSLTIEDKTAFGNWVQKGKLKVSDDEEVIEQFKELMEQANRHGYDHYEISNFSKPAFESKHNTSYWKGDSYLGIGPSAHSYNGNKRRWNIRNNPKYVAAIESGNGLFEEEVLSETDKFNEYLLTRLRTSWGVDLNFVKSEFGTTVMETLENDSSAFINRSLLTREKDHIYLTENGKLVADKITADLFAL